ncbi:MAG: hypothetical protein ABIB71_05955 [Candidatus Woesearchaeota archaeon]
MKLGIIVTQDLELYKSALGALVYGVGSMCVSRVENAEEIKELKLEEYSQVVMVIDDRSNVHNIREIVDLAKQYNPKVAIVNAKEWMSRN